MRRLFLIPLFFLILLPISAQDEPTPYEQALAKIEEAAATGATELDFSSMNLTELPPEIEQLTELAVLYLYNNQLTELPSEIGQLTNISQIYLANNHLTELPSEFYQLSNLHGLNLSNNQFMKLSPEFRHLHSLSFLNLNSNQIILLPPEIGQLTNLSQIHLANNKLTQLPSQLMQLTRLSILDISGNEIDWLAPNILRYSQIEKVVFTDDYYDHNYVDAHETPLSRRFPSVETMSLNDPRLYAPHPPYKTSRTIWITLILFSLTFGGMSWLGLRFLHRLGQ